MPVTAVAVVSTSGTVAVMMKEVLTQRADWRREALKNWCRRILHPYLGQLAVVPIICAESASRNSLQLKVAIVLR
jgi:hypothetical protein